MSEELTVKKIAKMHCLDVSLIEMIGAIEEEGCAWGLSGRDGYHEGVVFEEEETGRGNEYRAQHSSQPNAALHSAICLYVGRKATRKAQGR